MIKQFSKYFSIGVLNTLLHWLIFAIGFYLFSFSQAISNSIAFIVAVSFSFVMNAKYTFETKASLGRYIAFILFMGLLSYLVGYVSDNLHLHPIFTLIVFSAISLILGFTYSKLVVFKY